MASPPAPPASDDPAHLGPHVGRDGVELVDGGGVGLHRVHERASVAVGDRAAFFPALDGVRALAVAGVLLFHAEFTWAQGGFLGVSTFFTLSGFLIARLLMMEARDTGAIDPKRFFVRRARRLLPAGMLGIALAIAVVLLDERLVTSGGLSWDLLSAQFALANWRFALSGQSYSDLFATPSPVLHYWSLAVEEQFYLGLLVILLLTLRLTRQARRAVIPWVIVGLAGIVALAAFTIPKSIDRAYYGTDTRALEFLTGALLAAVLVHWRAWRTRLRIPEWAHRNAAPALGVASLLALQGMILFWVVAQQTDDYLYNGGLVGYSVLSATVIGACLVEGSPVAWLLSFAPLRYLGKISYGVYVYHWPIFLWLNPDRLDLGPWPLLAVRLAVTIPLAAASYHFVEMPIRERRSPWVRGAPLVRIGGAVGALIIAGASLYVGTARQPTLLTGDVGETASAEAPGAVPDQLDFLGPVDTSPIEPVGTASPAPEPTTPSPLPIPEVTSPSRPLRVMIVGDSTALHFAPGLKAWAQANGDLEVFSSAGFGCGILRADQIISQTQPQSVPAVCRNWAEDWAAKVEAFQPDVVLVGSALWDATDTELPDGTFAEPGQEAFTEFATAEYAEALDVLHAGGAQVQWVANPPVEIRKYRGARPERMAALNDIVADLAQDRPWLEVLPYDEYVEAWEADPSLPPLLADGLHVSLERTNDVGHWLAPVILDTFWSGAR